MKYILICLLLYPVTFFAQGSKQIQNRKIKEIVTVEFNAYDDAENRKIHEWYDAKGRLIERKVFNTGDTLRFHKIIEYTDRYGSYIETIMDIRTGKPKSGLKVVFNKWHDETENTRLNQDGKTVERKVSAYDAHGKLLKEVYYGDSDSLRKSIEYTYDHKGMLIKKEVRDKNGQTIEMKQLTYTY